MASPCTVAGLTIEELQAKKALLQAILYAPVKEVTVDGVRTSYKTDAEIQAAIAALDDLIDAKPTARHVRTSLGTGYTG